jgi:glyoxylase-like metal-dependent hydrolase (beta-lactamase superfamily II)
MLRLGAFELHLINDGRVMVDGGGAFGLVPRKLWSRSLQPTEDNLIPMDLNCLLVKAHGQNILMDTGMGINKLDEKHARHWNLVRPNGSLLDGLARLGMTADDIHLVINTHLHADHCTGNTRFDESGAALPSFPNAKYMVQRREYEDAQHPNERTSATYFLVNYKPVLEAGQMELLDGNTEFLPGIRGVVTPGHTPGHMSVVLESEGQHAMFICDLASFAVHFERLGWMTAYDVEPLVTLETKRVWQQWAIDTGALLVFPHDTQMPAARLELNDSGKPRLSAEPIEFA